MIIADLHNDTAYELFYGEKKFKKNNLHIDLQKQSFSKNLLFYSIYMNYELYGNDKWKYFFDIYNYFISELKENEEKIYLYTDIETFFKDNRQCAFLTLEGGDMIEDLKDIVKLKKLHIGSITLTWNKGNKIASSVCDTYDKGLSRFGREAVLKMNDLKLIIDLSHSSDKTFFDVIKLSEMPVIVSHSNSRSLKNEKRNITDEMFLSLKEKNGIAGINFYSEFLGENAQISDIIRHIEHFLKLGGENNIALGSDFDGVNSLPKDVTNFYSYIKIAEELKKNFGDKIAEKILYKNVFKLLKRFS